MIVGRTKPEIYALRLYQIEIEEFHFVLSQVIGGRDFGELQCLFPVVFENEASTPLSGRAWPLDACPLGVWGRRHPQLCDCHSNGSYKIILTALGYCLELPILQLFF
jgi:hypothetical protein